MRKALVRQLTKKSEKTEDLLGISFNEFKTPQVNWMNIELDHVRPLSSFDLTNPEQLKEASYYTNIQPLLKNDNRSKGSKFHEHDLVFQRDKVYEYEYFKNYSNNE